MRTVIKIMLLPISLWAACTNSNHKVTHFIAGTYVNHAQSEYSIADDTLLITQDQQNPNSYHITRKTGYQRIKDGKPGPAEHKAKTFTGLWDKGKQTLQITQNGIILLFQPDQNKLLIENSMYTKLKD
jgi:hypothetical protein